MKIRRVLVFPAGTEIGLEIYNSLKHCKEVEIFGAGQAISNPATFIFPSYHELPTINDSDWLQELIKLCRKLQIDYIFPAYDDAIVALAQNREKISAKVLIPSLEACLLTRSKALTYERLKSILRVPEIYSIGEADHFPLIVKPNRGQGSQDVTRVNSEQELSSALRVVNDPIICEYLPGEEFTVDCFSDRDRGLLFSGARIRLRTRNGIAVHTRSLWLDGVHEIASRISDELKLYGAWFFQLKRARNGELTLLEIAPRIAGSMSAHRVKGVNFPLLTIYESERLPLNLIILDKHIELDRSLQNRYQLNLAFEALYIDLDDTLILRGEVNLDALRLIFSCINKGIEIILITRHKGDLSKTLKKYRLESLFDDVIHLLDNQRKSDYIKNVNAIFVDDSFSERSEVNASLGIPTFDCSMIESLIFNRLEK
ncbi:ATP-grasp domain-containing protein [Polynucleobacter sp. MG-6-Vaara-E2]|uniref:ATP-grasp domain-containing protein n=1 Tax=Polynucleobacter sp. MG-6-Vaara-E2 TaxID=2576932 RepID=UPI001BFD6F3E|nr:ATP-grasp domain-containing protein [Polynucleobacter sp. MG-6-Vaara-E2]QWD96901.1 ATP-grasp domain-containing protein [Polynucleobacter sp. MG-6-Vaara-E2]